MLAELDARDLLEWEIVFGHEPFREHAADVRHSILCEQVALGRGVKLNPKVFTPWAKDAEEEGDPKLIAMLKIDAIKRHAIECGVKRSG